MQKLIGLTRSLGTPNSARQQKVEARPERESVPRYQALDVLRFVAASAAMIYHYSFRGYTADGLSVVRFDDLSPVTRYGHVGAAFFLISSFVISMSAEGRSSGQFLLARLRRLVPAFWVCCLLTAFASWAFAQPQFTVTVPQILGHMTMLRVLVGSPEHGLVDGAYWTLQIELRFYLMVALLLWWRPGKLGSTLPLVMAVGVLLATVNYFVITSGRDGIHVLRFAPLFAAGVAYGAVARRRATLLEWMLLATAVPLSLAYAHHDASVQSAHYGVTFSPVILVGTLAAFHVVLFLLSVVRLDIPASPAWKTLGLLTYPMFLLHQNIGYMILNASAGRVPPMVVLVSLCVSMPLVAYAISRWVEPSVRRRLDANVARIQSAWRSRRPVTAVAAQSNAAGSGAAA
jgi:peptidoglycan/LPS O-acetylase OafA/YrhL